MADAPHIPLPRGLYVGDDIPARVNAIEDDLDALGIWGDWTPVYNGITVGDGTAIARYVQVGKWVTARWSLDFGSTSALVSPASITLPVQVASDYLLQDDPIGIAQTRDADGAVYPLWLLLSTSVTVRPIAQVASGTYTSATGLSSTVPFTWAEGDTLSFLAHYEAA